LLTCNYFFIFMTPTPPLHRPLRAIFLQGNFNFINFWHKKLKLKIFNHIFTFQMVPYRLKQCFLFQIKKKSIEFIHSFFSNISLKLKVAKNGQVAINGCSTLSSKVCMRKYPPKSPFCGSPARQIQTKFWWDIALIGAFATNF
jgi:hypothetical protein